MNKERGPQATPKNKEMRKILKYYGLKTLIILITTALQETVIERVKKLSKIER